VDRPEVSGGDPVLRGRVVILEPEIGVDRSFEIFNRVEPGVELFGKSRLDEHIPVGEVEA